MEKSNLLSWIAALLLVSIQITCQVFCNKDWFGRAYHWFLYKTSKRLLVWGVLFLLLVTQVVCTVWNIKGPFDVVWRFFVDGSFKWEMLSAFGSIAILLSLPQIQEQLNRPQIELSLHTPDNKNKEQDDQYWHIKIENTGGVVEKANLYLVAFEYKDGTEQFIPATPFKWPWWGNNENLSPSTRSITKEQYVDFGHYQGTGNFQLALYTTPKNISHYLESEKSLKIAVQLIGEKYTGEKKWFCIKKTNDNNPSALKWSIKEA